MSKNASKETGRFRTADEGKYTIKCSRIKSCEGPVIYCRAGEREVFDLCEGEGRK